jgi:hypothetical protein
MSEPPYDERFEQEPLDDPNEVSESDYFWSDPEIDPEFVNHECVATDERAGQPNKSGIVVVERLCWCGRKMSSYIDSVL